MPKILIAEDEISLARSMGDALGAVAAYRFKCQVNENAKAPAFWAAVPEMAHNEICGWGQHGDVTRQVGAGRHLLRQEALCPVIGVGRERRGGLLCLGAGLLRDIGKLRDSFACFCPDALLQSRLAGSR